MWMVEAESRRAVQRRWLLAERMKSGGGVKGWQMKLGPNCMDYSCLLRADNSPNLLHPIVAVGGKVLHYADTATGVCTGQAFQEQTVGSESDTALRGKTSDWIASSGSYGL